MASVRSRAFTTFQDLEIDVPGFRGEYGMFSPIRESIIMWHAVSHGGVQCLSHLIGLRLIFVHIAPNVSYRNTGDLPPVPICRSIPDFESDTKVIRWFPVVFTLEKEFEGRCHF